MLIFVEFFKTQSKPKRTKLPHNFKKFLGGAYDPEPPNICVQRTYILHETSHFIFKIISKYTSKRINNKMFFKSFFFMRNTPVKMNKGAREPKLP